MVPPFVRSWMSTHRHPYGDLPIGDLCLPNSHDAGTYRYAFGTSFAKEGAVITQTKSIFDQLELGVRMFDIRPTLSASFWSGEQKWYCGHWTAIDNWPKLGFQGGNCASIQQVVDDVNRFTKDNSSELIILELKNIWHIKLDAPVKAAEVGLQKDEWLSLFKLLSGIQNLYTLTRSGGDKNRTLHDRCLNDFIADNKSAVVVIVDSDANPPDLLYEYGLWPTKTANGQPTLKMEGASVLRQQGAKDVGFSIFGFNDSSVLSLADQVQHEEFPFLLQKIASNPQNMARAIQIDRIENPDLLTFCLAVMYQRYNNARNLPDKVIVYGGQLVTDPNVHKNIQEAIDKGRSFPVENGKLGGDPWWGMQKSCAVFYRHNGLLKARWSKEGGHLHFELDVISIQYGPKEVRDQDVYARVLECIATRKRFRADNGTLGGDPLPNVAKQATIRWRDLAGTDIRSQQIKEGAEFDFDSPEEAAIKEKKAKMWEAAEKGGENFLSFTPT